MSASPVRARSLALPLALVLAASVLDELTTWAVFARGGHEINPLAALLYDRWGFGAVVALRASTSAAVCLICLLLSRRWRRDPPWSRVAHAIACVGAALCCVGPLHNLALLTGLSLYLK